MKVLKSFNLREDIFDKILYDFSFDVKIVDSLTPYYCGYKNKRIIYYNGVDQLICREYILDNYINYNANTEWKQIRLIKNQNLTDKIQDSTNGPQAWNYINRLLKKYYSVNEINYLLCKHEEDEDKSLSQYHYTYMVEKNVCYKITNTYKYDINGAHLDALCEIFPKAKDDFLKMYNKRKTNVRFKQYPNFYVGMLVKKSFRRTYNWIVHRTTKMLFRAMDYVNGEIIYANTDGFVVKNPANNIITNKFLGNFKLEHQGDSYFYRDKNYTIYQFGNELKGSCFCSVRDKIDLSKGEVVHYDIKVNNELNYRYADNITTEIVDICEQ